MLFNRERKEREIQKIEQAELDGKVRTQITVNSVDRLSRTVKIVITEKLTGSVVFHCEYSTGRKESEAYLDANVLVKHFVGANDYYIEGAIITNVEQPSVSTVKRFR